MNTHATRTGYENNNASRPACQLICTQTHDNAHCRPCAAAHAIGCPKGCNAPKVPRRREYGRLRMGQGGTPPKVLSAEKRLAPKGRGSARKLRTVF